MTKTLTAAAALAAVATTLAPAVAGAHGRHGGPAVTTKPAHSTTRYTASGTVASVDAGAHTVTVDVTRASQNGSSLVGQRTTFDVTNGRLIVADANASGTRDLGDVATGDHVVVLVKQAAASAGQPTPAATIVDRDAAKRAPLSVTFTGSVTAVDAAAKTVTVQAGGLTARGTELGLQSTETFSLASVKLHVRDSNGDGARDLADVVVGDRVAVRTKIARTTPLTRPLVAERLSDVGQRHHRR